MAGPNANTMCKISLDRKNIKIDTSWTCGKNDQALIKIYRWDKIKILTNNLAYDIAKYISKVSLLYNKVGKLSYINIKICCI